MSQLVFSRHLVSSCWKSLDTMEKTHVSQQGAVQGELRQEMALFQKKILMDTVSKMTDQLTKHIVYMPYVTRSLAETLLMIQIDVPF